MGVWDTAKKVGKSFVDYEREEIRKQVGAVQKQQERNEAEIQRYRERFERYDSQKLREIGRQSSSPLQKMAIKQILIDRGEM